MRETISYIYTFHRLYKNLGIFPSCVPHLARGARYDMGRITRYGKNYATHRKNRQRILSCADLELSQSCIAYTNRFEVNRLGQFVRRTSVWYDTCDVSGNSWSRYGTCECGTVESTEDFFYEDRHSVCNDSIRISNLPTYGAAATPRQPSAAEQFGREPCGTSRRAESG
jgi:hypothetical protein